MKQRVSDYIADYMAEHGITTVFTVVGGGAMHLNDSLGHHKQLHCVYNHHEQASAIAAEGYARINGQMAAVCVTSGPGAINALNGVAGAYMDSIPMLVLSGQTKTTLTVQNSGLNLRTLGNQEFDIVPAVKGMTKYAEMIMDPQKIRYCLEKACFWATSGRPGPCWLDIPLDIQGSLIDADTLEGYIPEDVKSSPDQSVIKVIAEKLCQAERPVFYIGNGVRIAGAVEQFKKLLEKLPIPVVTCWDSIDVIETDHPLYTGRGGTMGDRAGNFAVQNSDLLICIGSRLNIYQMGYDVSTWARAAFTVVNDIDAEELKKPTIRVDLPLCCDCRDFIKALSELGDSLDKDRLFLWQNQCRLWKEKYPVVQPYHYDVDHNQGAVNVYAFIDTISRMLDKGSITVVANGSASVVGSQAYVIKDGTRFIMNCGLSSMGYDLPAAIGACIGNNKRNIVCIAGDGSMQMNLQELQTIATNQLPIKIFVINNGGYHQIRLTQRNLFKGKPVGIGPESGDLGFPDMDKLACAYGVAYARISSVEKMEAIIERVLVADGPYICEVLCTTTQIYEPKSSVKRLEDGRLVSPPLEDLAPFLSRDELAKNMYIDLVSQD